jgi:hypothetical protein
LVARWKIVHSGSGFGGVVLPSACDGQNPNPPENADPNDPTTMMCKSRNYVILSDQSMYIDQQPLKLQESPEVSHGSGLHIVKRMQASPALSVCVRGPTDGADG